VDVSDLDQDALAWFLKSAFAKGLKDKSLGGQGGGQGGEAFTTAKAEMAKREVSDADFVRMRMAAVGHDVDVSDLDQDALAWFLESAFAKGLKGKSLGGQGGEAFTTAKAEMNKRKVSDGDFVRMRMAAVGHDVDVSDLNQDALAWFLDCAFAKGLKRKSLGGQAGSHRQVNEHTPEWLWEHYKRHVGQGPLAASCNNPLLFSLAELSANDQDGVFDRLVLTMLESPSWHPARFSQDNGVDEIREKIHHETQEQCGAHIGNRAPDATQLRLDRIRKIQKEWDTQAGTHNNTQWEPPPLLTDHALTKRQRSAAREATITNKYRSMEREVQMNVVNTLSDNDRARLAVHLALGWYQNSVKPSGAA
jgi:hypothetical protein